MIRFDFWVTTSTLCRHLTVRGASRTIMAKSSPQEVRPSKPKNVSRDPVASGERDATQNRAAGHDYFLLEKLEVGIVLRGTEVKSVREGRANLKDAYGLVKDGELFLLNAHIGPYGPAAMFNHENLRTRKLLAKKSEIEKLFAKTQQKGLTLIPTRMYFRKGKVKVEVALAKGKQLWDKRETERRRTADKETREAIARSRKS
jgi:SsrA-binding protein